MPDGRRRRKLQIKKMYAYGCGKESIARADHSQLGGSGFSRVVLCNKPESCESSIRKYPDNYVKTTKYTFATFVPKLLFEQFRRVANLYFLVAAILAFTPLVPYPGVGGLVPSFLAIGMSMLTAGLEDWKRMQQDKEVNSRKIKVHSGDGVFEQVEWGHLQVGDLVKVGKDELFPADVLLLSSSYEDSICYVETRNLDGETNLKTKQALEVTSFLLEDSSFPEFRATIRCEDPNPNLYTFVGSLEIKGEQYSLGPQQMLLRGKRLRNTDFVYGIVIFTGHDTKIMQNATGPPSKRSRIERKMDMIICILLYVMFFLSFIGSVCFGVITKRDLKNGMMRRWYLRPDDSKVHFDPERAPAAAFLHFLTVLTLYSYFIPTSLYLCLDVVKFVQSIFINQDIHMYNEEAGKAANARTSNLNEELGQVDIILSDKTGTLTCNSMEFIKCSVAGTDYGRSVTELERSIAKKEGSLRLDALDDNSSMELVDGVPAVKGFNFKDVRMTDGNWVFEPHADVIQKFLQLLAICHTVIPHKDEETGKVTYEAESPDEVAFVVAAKEIGFEFFERTHTSISLYEFDPRLRKQVVRKYKILDILEFNSTRKRMSVIVETEERKILLLSKGADSSMFAKLAKNGAGFEEETQKHVNYYAHAGLRTLVLAYRELSKEEYRVFNEKFSSGKKLVNEHRDTLIDQVTETIEKDLILLGATAIEDKLQPGVIECIDKLAVSGIKIWVLTGDKMETAINVGFACNLLKQEMRQIIINLDTPDIKALEQDRDIFALNKECKGVVQHQLKEGNTLLEASDTRSTTFALIIDGTSLAYALDDDVKNLFLQLARKCVFVICCRLSPKQKALVTRLVKEGSKRATLAIGDGVNDVAMLQEADIGVRISGGEGMQAGISSDIDIPQFRHLERLLLVHGYWSYRRIAHMVCYLFYKNITLGVTLFLFEAYTSFSVQPAYNDWFLSLYNICFSFLPPVVLGVFDQDNSSRQHLKFPLLYQEGVQDKAFSWVRVLGWMLNGFYSGAMIFFFTKQALEIPALNQEGKTAGYPVFGATMYTAVVLVVNCQMALFLNYFTCIHHIVIWGEIALCYIFLLAYGAVNPDLSTTAYHVLLEELSTSPRYWLVIIFVLISALIPSLTYRAVRTSLFPEYHNMVQWIGQRS